MVRYKGSHLEIRVGCLVCFYTSKSNSLVIQVCCMVDFCLMAYITDTVIQGHFNYSYSQKLQQKTYQWHIT